MIDKDHAGRRRALAWVALREGGLNAALVRMESVGEPRRGPGPRPRGRHPEPELRRGRRRGAHRLDDHRPHPAPRGPRRARAHLVGGRDARAGTAGSLPEEYPRVVDPPSGRIWTANARVVGGEKLAKVGVGGYDLGARQGQIRDDLLALDKASESDMLRDPARRPRALPRALAEAAPRRAHARRPSAKDPRRAEARRLVEALGRARLHRLGRLPRRPGLPRAGEGLRPRPAPRPRAREGRRSGSAPGTAPNARVGGAGVGARHASAPRTSSTRATRAGTRSSSPRSTPSSRS